MIIINRYWKQNYISLKFYISKANLVLVHPNKWIVVAFRLKQTSTNCQQLILLHNSYINLLGLHLLGISK
jgi:hypothetical protein